MSASRLYRFSLIMIGVYCLLMLMTVIRGQMNGLIGEDLPLGIDFIAFWTASSMALDGQLVSAFDPDIFAFEKQQVIAGTGYGFLWLYPPTFALFVLPLAFLPYLVSYGLWCIAGLAAFYGMVKRLGADGKVMIIAFGAPFAYLAVLHGQNSLFVAALFGLAAHCLVTRRDMEAGLWIALMMVKPHLGLLLPFALLVSGRWKAFASACVFSLLFLGLSSAVFGLSYWQAFLEHAHLPMLILENGEQQGAIVSVFAFMRSALEGLGVEHARALAVAYGVHWTIAAGVAVYTLLVMRRTGFTALSTALLIVASVMISPYMFYYDLTVLVPAGLLAWRASPALTGNQKKALVGVVMLPLCLTPLSDLTGLSVGFILPLTCFVILALHAGPAWQGLGPLLRHGRWTGQATGTERA